MAYSASENSCQIPWHATSYTILMSIFSALCIIVEMSVQHSSIGSTLGTTEGCVIRSFMQNQDFTFPPPLLDQSQTLVSRYILKFLWMEDICICFPKICVSGSLC